MMPKYFVLLVGLICICRSCSVTLSLLLLLCAKSIDASFKYSSGELWILDQSETPPSLHIMLANLSCAAGKVSAVATIIVSSMHQEKLKILFYTFFHFFVAPSGIAALLLKGGHTAHSCFRIPIPCYESSICSIIKNSEQADLIHMTNLVIWDEAPMQHRHVIETVDHTFRDLCNSPDAPFGRITFVFGGDFKQILLVIISRSRA